MKYRTAWAWGLGAAILAGGCSGGARQSSLPEVNTGLHGLASGRGSAPAGPAVPPAAPLAERPPNKFERMAAETALDLDNAVRAPAGPAKASPTSAVRGVDASGPTLGRVERRSDAMGEPESVSAGLAGDAEALDPDQTFDGYAARAAADGSGWPGEPAAPAILASGPAPASVEERIAELARALASLLREKAESSDAPIREYLALAAVEPLAGQGAAEGGGAEPAGVVSLQGAAVYGVVRDLMAHAAASGPDACAEESLAAALTEGARRLDHARPVRIARAEMCRQVSGFGLYEPLPGSTFLAGQTHRVIVYVEVENFAHRAAKPEDSVDGTTAGAGGWAVEVSQELDLRHSRDDVQAWYRPPQTVVDVSRNKRRDFFVRQIVELPATLSVGSYVLRVTMRDRTTGASDEVVLPITVVADPGLVNASATPIVPD